MGIEGGVGVNANYPSYASNSAISSGLACLGMSPTLSISPVEHYSSLHQRYVPMLSLQFVLVPWFEGYSKGHQRHPF